MYKSLFLSIMGVYQLNSMISWKTLCMGCFYLFGEMMFRWNEMVNIKKIDVSYVKEALCGIKANIL